MPRAGGAVGNNVSQNNFATRLTKELTRNPKKTGVLALLLLVAMWFWVPLAWKWVAPSGESVVEVEKGESISPDVVGVGNAITKSIAAPNPKVEMPWRKLSELFVTHPLMATAELRKSLESPFGKVEAATAVNEENTNEEGEVVATRIIATPTPQQLGLTLSSTITGQGARLAIINGKSCRLGAVLVIAGQGRSTELRLVGIQADSVQLFDGNEVQELKRTASPSTMQLSLTGGSQHGNIRDPDYRVLIDAGHRD